MVWLFLLPFRLRDIAMDGTQALVIALLIDQILLILWPSVRRNALRARCTLTANHSDEPFQSDYPPNVSPGKEPIADVYPT